MKRSTKIFGFFFAASMLAAACGNDSGTSNEAAPADTATVDTSADDGDRDRNVEMAGWGVDKSGSTEVVVNDRAHTNVSTRVFRRSRIEVVGGRKVVNNRDVFVASMVGRYSRDSAQAFMKVAGYDTTGDDPTLYTMKGFGDKGVVTISFPERTNGWASWPAGWTIISRDIIAVFFDNWSDTPEDRGVIEYYDLRTGGLVTTLGNEGRTIIPREFPISWVRDIGLRSVDDDGAIHLLLAGDANFGEENAAVMVAGITPDGRLDPLVGADGAGTIDYAASMAPASSTRTTQIRIADPGIESNAPAIGLVVVSEDLSTKVGDDPGEDIVTYIVSRAASATSPFTRNARSSFVLNQPTGQSNVNIRNVAHAPNGRVAVHMTGNEVGKYWWNSASTNRFVLATGTGLQEKPVSAVNWSGVGPDVSSADSLVIDVSSEGRTFAVEGFNNQVELRYEERVCFSPPACLPPESFATVTLAEIGPLEGTSPIPQSVSVDSSGIRIVVENVNYDSNTRLYTIANFDSDGARAGTLSATLDKVFSSQTFTTVTTNTGPSKVVDSSTSWPITLDAKRVVAIRSGRSGMSLVVQEQGKDPKEVKLAMPLGIAVYSTLATEFVSFDANHVSMIATVDNGITRVRRIYKVNVDNGSVDTTFGTNGYVEIPMSRTSDACMSINRVAAAPGAVASTTTEWPKGEEEPDCADAPSRVKWTAFGTDGKQIGNKESIADVSKIAGDWAIAPMIDNRGNLFYVKHFANFDDMGEFVSAGVRIAKFGPSGELDATFGKAGILELTAQGGVQLGVDAEGRLYVTNLELQEVMRITRYSTTGVLDAVVAAAPTTTAASERGAESETSPRKKQQSDEKQKEFSSNKAFEAEETKKDSEPAVATPNNGITIATDKPVLVSVTSDEDRSLTIAWALSAAAGKVYVTATANPGGRTCTSDTGSCVIRGLDPTETYTITLAKKGEEPEAPTVIMPTKPVVSLKVGRVASPTTFLRPASKGKATWKVRGGCKLNETNTRLMAPKSPGSCQLSVTTAKFGSTPKTTKSVTIVVKK